MAEQQDATQDGADTGARDAGETPTFDTWLAAQDEGTRTLLEKHTAGLKSALGDEKDNRKVLAKQIVELSKQAEAGSALKTNLDALTSNFEKTSRKATFYESAPGDVRNLKLAWLAAEDAELVDKDGAADWKALRTQAPELFGKVTPGNAGNGAGQTGQGSDTMNSFIRRSAGRNG